jgi:hypothetical protein
MSRNATSQVAYASVAPPPPPSAALAKVLGRAAPTNKLATMMMMMIYYKKSLVKKDETKDTPLVPNPTNRPTAAAVPLYNSAAAYLQLAIEARSP